jgi:hypothetical protein
MSRGKNIRGWASVFCEEAATGTCTGAGALCALPKTEINSESARIHPNILIQPPKVCLLANNLFRI